MVAAARGNSAMVKKFGEKMAVEHQQSLDELAMLAAKGKVYLPTTLDEKHKTLKEKLKMLSGYSFDTAYIHSQVKDHEKAVMLYQSELDSGKAPDVKSYAGKYLPHIKMHLEKADSIAMALMP